MRRKAKRSPEGSSSGRGSRLGLAILAATVAAFMLVPVAAQAEIVGTETLKVNIKGSGSGEVRTKLGLTDGAKGEPPMACVYEGKGPGTATGICEDLMTEGVAGFYAGFESVYLEANAALGSELVGWTTENGESESCEVLTHEIGICLPYVEPPGEGPGEFGEKTEIGVEFALETGELLTVNLEEGMGSVASSPAGIEVCTTAVEQPKTCGKSFAANELVTLTASPWEHYLFKGWKKCDKKVEVEPGVFTGVNGRQCTVKMSEAKTVGAKFIPAHKLTALKASGSGPGTVKTSPAGVNCGVTCTSAAALYKEAPLTVKEKPAKHFHFVEFKEGTNSAEACNGVTAETCAIASFTEDSAIKALFAEDTKHTLSYSAYSGSGAHGQGSVKTKPAGISCGYTCTASTASFYENEGEVEVKVKLGKGTSKVIWSTGAGTCTGTVEEAEFTCKVPMTANKTLVAKFE